MSYRGVGLSMIDPLEKLEKAKRPFSYYIEPALTYIITSVVLAIIATTLVLGCMKLAGKGAAWDKVFQVLSQKPEGIIAGGVVFLVLCVIRKVLQMQRMREEREERDVLNRRLEGAAETLRTANAETEEKRKEVADLQEKLKRMRIELEMKISDVDKMTSNYHILLQQLGELRKMLPSVRS